MNRSARTMAIVCLLAGVVFSTGGMAAPGPATATLEVGTSANCAYHSIAAAIAAANPGDTIKVENTLFVESPLAIAKDLTLAGGYPSAHPYGCLTQTGYNYTTVRRSGTSNAPILRITAARVTLSWFIFENNSQGGGLEANGATLYLQDSIIRDNSDSGLRVSGGSDVTLTNAEISGNSATVGGGLNIDGGSQVVAENTLIRNNNGQDYGAGVYVQANSSFTAIKGTSIQHNRTVLGCDRGGGIYATGAGSRVLIDASYVISNTALLQGGGLYLADGAEATIQDNSLVRDNLAYGPASIGGGGGVYLEGSDTVLNVFDSVFYNNWADPAGGGIWNEFGTVNLTHAFLLANNAARKGGGLYTSFGPTTIQESIFYGNVATYDSGGAIATYRALLTVHRSYFTANTADLEGSALYVEGANGPYEPAAEIVNCYLVDNRTTAHSIQGPPATGSTLYVGGTAASLIHNTLAHATQQASFGLYVGDGADLTLRNNILAGFYTGIRRPSDGTGVAASDHDLFYNNAVNYDAAGVSVSNPVLGDPAFAGGSNYHLTASSAAIDAGVEAGVFVDYDGDSRPWAAGFDIGADEYPDRHRLFLPSIRRGQ